MKKCTLCVDRIYNETLDPADRVPACVAVCPTRARHFGDLGDPEFDVSQLVRAREGRDLMPELGYRPVNKYLPPRAPRVVEHRRHEPESLDLGAHPFLRWLDRLLSPPDRHLHPAYSLIFFTTASGAGYGLLASAAPWPCWACSRATGCWRS